MDYDARQLFDRDSAGRDIGAPRYGAGDTRQ